MHKSVCRPASLLNVLKDINFVAAPFPRERNPDFGADGERRFLNPVEPLLCNLFPGTVEQLLAALAEQDEVVVDSAAFMRLMLLANAETQPPFHPGDETHIRNKGVFLLAPSVEIPIFSVQLVVIDGDLFAGMGPDGPLRADLETWTQITIDTIEACTNIALTCDDEFLRAQALVATMASMKIDAKRDNTEKTAETLGEAFKQVVDSVLADEREIPELSGLTPGMICAFPI